ncbi:MAG: hypothetical protein J6X55_11440 [Victivallales bacterium]|nr:hypothetical protein [Victivallales bacterium]
MTTLKNGDAFSLKELPSELTAQVPKGGRIRFLLEEPPGSVWSADYNDKECSLLMEHRPGEGGIPARAAIEVASFVQTPARIVLTCGSCHSLTLLVYTVNAQIADPKYPRTPVFNMLMTSCKKRGITLTDWHLHIRGGMTPALAADRELDSGIRSTAMENHGREWEIYDNARLRAFADEAKKVVVGDHRLPVGIQVNDRDWFKQIDSETRSRFDYILADTMIMGKLPSGRDNRLWLDQSIPNPAEWMEGYVAHTLRILDEPITILANPTYLPKEVAAFYDALWTEERMKAVISKAIDHGIALEVQAGSPFPRPCFLKMAKTLGARFSFGTNNFDPTPKDLSRWLEAIEWLDLSPSDILS